MLTLFGIGDLSSEGCEACGLQLVTYGVTCHAQRTGMDHQNLFDPLPQELRKVGQQSTAHYDVVVVLRQDAGDLDDCVRCCGSVLNIHGLRILFP